MKQPEVRVVRFQAQTIYGLWQDSSDKTIGEDIPTLSKQYHHAIAQKQGTVLPFYVLTKDYDVETGSFQLFIGGILPSGGLEMYQLPAGDYGKMTVHPRLGFLWGAAIGEAKRYFYTKWLPQSQFAGRNMEYELHTAQCKSVHPYIDLLFAIQPKDV